MKLSLYEIEQKLEQALDAIDWATGEILDEELADKIGGLKVAREEKIHNIALYIIKLVRYGDMVKAEIVKLTGMKKSNDNKVSSLKKFLASFLNDGEKFKFSNATIGWRKSSSIVIDEGLDLELYADEYPGLVSKEIVRILDKKKAKLFFEEVAKVDGVPLFYDGIHIVEKQNIQIK